MKNLAETAKLNMASEVKLMPFFQELAEKVRRILARFNLLIFMKTKVSISVLPNINSP